MSAFSCLTPWICCSAHTFSNPDQMRDFIEKQKSAKLPKEKKENINKYNTPRRKWRYG